MEPRVKYPRTPHLPWSEGTSSDDIVANLLRAENVVVTEKMDGENTTMYADGLHARSVDGRHHPSRDWVKRLHAAIAYKIPKGYRICGENLFAEHSIRYEALPSYFLVFSVWAGDTCLSWNDTISLISEIGLLHVPVLYQGPYTEEPLRNLSIDEATCEGYVVRNSQAFCKDAFSENIAKWVRPHHVQTDEHWMTKQVVPNGLKEES